MATNTKKTTRAAAAKADPTADVETVETPAAAEVTEQAATPTVDAEEVKPVSAPPSRLADQRIISIAYTIMAEFPDNGATEADLAEHTSIEEKELAQLLSAMVRAEAAVRSVTDGETGEIVRYTLGTTKPSLVDPANLPPCPTCGIVPPPIRVNGSNVKRTNSTGGTRGGVNADGKPTLKPGELADMVKGLVAEHEGVSLTATEIAKELSIRHDRTIGASSVAYTIDAMLKKGDMKTDPRPAK